MEITPELREDICVRFAESQNALQVSRETGVSGYRIRRIWDGLTIEERERYSAMVQNTVQAVTEAVLDRRADEVAEYAGQLLRVRMKALTVVEKMLDAIPTDDPNSLGLLKDVGKVMRDLHDMSTAAEVPRSNSADEFYQLLKSPSTINVQNNYYGKTEAEHPDSGDQPRRIG